jgi:hypothetical protein
MVFNRVGASQRWKKLGRQKKVRVPFFWNSNFLTIQLPIFTASFFHLNWKSS